MLTRRWWRDLVWSVLREKDRPNESGDPTFAGADRTVWKDVLRAERFRRYWGLCGCCNAGTPRRGHSCVRSSGRPRCRRVMRTGVGPGHAGSDSDSEPQVASATQTSVTIILQLGRTIRRDSFLVLFGVDELAWSAPSRAQARSIAGSVEIVPSMVIAAPHPQSRLVTMRLLVPDDTPRAKSRPLRILSETIGRWPQSSPRHLAHERCPCLSPKY